MNYAVIGTGAIGGYYGAQLARIGRQVHFLLHSDYQYVRTQGLQVTSCDGDFHIPHPHAYHDPHDMPQVDVVIVALKTTNQHLLPTLLPPLLHPNTLVLLIQNGIHLEPDLQHTLPQLHLAAGLAFICAAKTQPGHIHHQCYGSINIGNYSCPDNTIIQNIIHYSIPLPAEASPLPIGEGSGVRLIPRSTMAKGSPTSMKRMC